MIRPTLAGATSAQQKTGERLFERARMIRHGLASLVFFAALTLGIGAAHDGSTTTTRVDVPVGRFGDNGVDNTHDEAKHSGALPATSILAGECCRDTGSSTVNHAASERATLTAQSRNRCLSPNLAPCDCGCLESGFCRCKDCPSCERPVESVCAACEAAQAGATRRNLPQIDADLRQAREELPRSVSTSVDVLAQVNPPTVRIIVPEKPMGGLYFVMVDGLSTKDDYALTIVPPTVPVLDLADRQGRPILPVPADGTYTIVLAHAIGGKVQQVTATVGTGPLPPVPPGPNPPVPPGPVVEGKRALLIVRESAETTPIAAMMITGLRTGANAEYLKSKGHTLSILDDDSVDPDGKPSPAVEAWRPQFAGMVLPVLFVIDPATNKLIHKETLPGNAKADDVLRILKANGG